MHLIRCGRKQESPIIIIYITFTIIFRLTCPHLSQAIEEFSETISLLFDVDDPK